MNKIVFKKEYTRDYSMIMEEIWVRAFYKSPFNDINPYKTKIIWCINDGVVEVWENKEAIKWFSNKLHQKNQEDPNFFHSKMDEYDVILEDLKNIWSKKNTSSLIELKNFIADVTKAVDYFLIFYYSVLDNKTSQEILDRAKKLRDEDELYEAADNFIRNSIEKIYPQTKNFSNTILMKELDKIPDIKILQARYKNFIADFDNDFFNIIRLDDFLKKNKQYNFIFDKITDYNQVTGQVAYKGKVKGKVKILKRKNQVSEFAKGQILVSPMTTPDFLPAMKKAVAFVTDEGGIVCHAAIIARELKIPCVIGTKVATQVFKDGDMVEVDAEQGIVKKLN